jgi:hypothetical protein
MQLSESPGDRKTCQFFNVLKRLRKPADVPIIRLKEVNTSSKQVASIK